MAQAAIDLQRPAKTRTELTLSSIGQQWAAQRNGRAFTEALVDFLRSKTNGHSLRSYSFAVLEFFGWYAAERGRFVTPDQIRRADAVQYEDWLRKRRYGLRKWHLENDPSRRLDLAIYELVQQSPGLRLAELRGKLLQQHPGMATWVTIPGEDYRRVQILAIEQRDRHALAKRLGCLCEVKTLTRRPSIAQIRRGEIDVGLPAAMAKRVGLDVPVPHEVFRYFAPEKRGSEAERASTVGVRLSALSALWSYLMQAGENVGSAEPLLRVNIWAGLLRKAQRQAPSLQRATRAAKTPSMSLFERLLATTYIKRYGDGALQMAASRMRPGLPAPFPTGRRRDSFSDVRDRAVLLLMGQTGLRSDEVRRLRRSSVVEGNLIVSGKGGKRRRIRLPPQVAAVLGDLDRRLQQLAEHQARYYPESGRAERLLSAEAPLLPAVAHWGKNAGKSDMAGLSRQGIAMMLRRRAIRAGIAPDSPDFGRVHPHGLRHMFAKASLEAGTPLNVTQAIMGHSRGSQTLQYMEEHAPEALIARPFAAAAPAPPAMPAAAAQQPTQPAQAAAARLPGPQQPRAPHSPSPASPAPSPAPSPPAARPPQGQPARRPPAGFSPPRLVQQIPTLVEEPEGLIGVGQEVEPDEQQTISVETEETSLRLGRIYNEHWGEPGNRRRLGAAGASSEQAFEQLGVDAELAALSGAEEIVEAVGVGADKLVHTYVGRSSGLVWWLGPTGKLSPAMPVMSPGQVGECSEEQQDAVCRGLAALWARWMAGEGRGPTGASALVGWVLEALEVSSQVAAEVASRDWQWLPTEAPWDETSHGDALREHEAGAIVEWFETVAWQLRRARTRGQSIIDKPPSPPAYYDVLDPIGALDDDERAELLDWVAALTGQQPRDQRLRFDGVSRADVARFVGQMCLYDQQLELLGVIRAEMRSGESTDIEQQAVKRSAERAAEQVNRLALTIGAPGGFDIRAAVAERIERRKGPKGQREFRRDFYLRLVEQLFGKEAAEDAPIRLVAMCGRTPLGEERFRKLFRIDWLRRTVAHDGAFMREFGEQFGTHSECVGRRLARDLWELRKRHLSGDRQRVLSRPDELLEMVDAMMAYRMPCPPGQERQLAALLGKRAPAPLYGAWSAAEASKRIVSRPAARVAIEQELDELSELYGEDIAADLQRDIFRENPAAASALPGPIHLVAALMLR